MSISSVFNFSNDFESLSLKDIKKSYLSKNRDSLFYLQNTTKGSFAQILSNLESEKPIAVITPDFKSAEKLYNNLSYFCTDYSQVTLFEDYEYGPYDEIVEDSTARFNRFKTLFKLTHHSSLNPLNSLKFAVIAAPSLCRITLPVNMFLKGCLNVEKEITSRDEMLESLVKGGYSLSPTVTDIGTYAVRGSLIDLFVPEREFPVRIDFLGNSVETIYEFDPATQRRFKEIDSFYIHTV
ncbi:MAG: hypothetical protein JXR91_08295, partial [Deltaproteobacteria bacterium]|nr:hypothetical protein [Deltaproteobacteria bacterium]